MSQFNVLVLLKFCFVLKILKFLYFSTYRDLPNPWSHDQY